MTKKNIICITPIKNEEWILEKFLRCTSLWADYIILADQNSTDRSREIASKFGKVILIENDSLELDEIHRQNLLLDEARKIEGENIIFSFDADEILSSNFHDSLEWTSIKNYKKGTVFKFKRCEIMPNFKQYWIPKNEESWGYWGFVDDGSVMDGPSIHSNRLPINFDNEIIKLEEIKLLHFQYTDWQRMESKHRWYKCFERIKFPTKKAIDICNLYNTVYELYKYKMYEIENFFFNYYEKNNINIHNINKEETYWWDIEVLEWFSTYGLKYFKKLDIWDYQWGIILQKVNKEKVDKIELDYFDPRNIFERIIHKWLRANQGNNSTIYYKVIQMLKKIGW